MLDTFRGGYTKALLDVKDIIQDRSEWLVHRNIMTKKAIKFVGNLIDAIIAGKDDVMAYGSMGVAVVQMPEGKLSVHKDKAYIRHADGTHTPCEEE